MELWGNLKDFSLPDVIQLVGFGRKTGVLSVEHGELSSLLYFQDGNVVHAELNEVEGEEAVYALFRFDDGEFRFQADTEPPRQTIFMDPTNLVMEAARLMDEAGRGPEEEPEQAPEPEPFEPPLTTEQATPPVAEAVEAPEPIELNAADTGIYIEPEEAVEPEGFNPNAAGEALPGADALDQLGVFEGEEPAPEAPVAEEQQASPGEIRDQIIALLDRKFGRDAKRLLQAVEKCGDTYDDFLQLSVRIQRFVSAFVDPDSAKLLGEELEDIIRQLAGGR